MPETRYDLYFSGKTMEGSDPQTVRSKIGRLFAANDKTLDRLFSGSPVRVKSEVDQETASKYRVAFREAGALLDIRPATASNRPATTRPDESEPWTLLPPNTGSLIDCAPPVTALPIAETPGISLAPPGADMDTAEDPQPAVIDISGLTMSAPRTGSLEDYQSPVLPAPIPDISALELEKRDKPNPSEEDLV
ncbi:MAG: hypothetical protein KDI63_15915 [Gammaproteobacteria bacterium]|nr:hypothetical protein [Gammaproteobacteria bacterium]